MGASTFRTYNAAIIATKCRTCGAESPNRCRPVSGGSSARYNYPPHITRVEDSLKENVE